MQALSTGRQRDGGGQAADADAIDLSGRIVAVSNVVGHG